MRVSRETSREIDDAAALWAARVERDLTSQEAAELEQWLAQDVRRLGAYARARAIAANSRRLGALNAASNRDPLASPTALATDRSAQRHRVINRRVAIAAVATLGMGGAGLGAAVWRHSQSYRTGLGEVKEFVLEDGSRMSLSALTSVSLRFSRSAREVVMAAGEALFEVADDSRPFRVLTAGVAVVADNARVLLRRYDQGPLDVATLAGKATLRASEADPLLIDAGHSLKLDESPEVAPLEAGQAQRALAWREGRLALHNETLSEAARSFARFSAQRISFGDAAAGDQRITGLFNARDPLTFAKAAAASLGLALSATPQDIRLSSM
ncbi:fec operon regulator FecR [compost metagenome]|jgi:transmembrane sensor